MYTILIVDDDEISRSTINFILADENLDIQYCRANDEVIQNALQLNPDVILLDSTQPGSDCPTIICKIRSSFEIKKVPILLAFSAEDARLNQAYYLSEVDDIILKPFNRFELLARIRTLTRFQRSPGESTERERVEGISKMAHFGIVIVDPEGKILFDNPASEKMFDWESRKPATFLEILSPPDQKFLKNSLWKYARENDRNETIEVKIPGNYEENRYISINIRHINWDGEPAIRLLLADISGIKKTEEELHQLITQQEKTIQYLLSLERIAETLRRADTLDEMYPSIVSETLNSLSADFGVMLVREGRYFRPVAVLGEPPVLWNRFLDVSNEKLIKILEDGKPLFIDADSHLTMEKEIELPEESLAIIPVLTSESPVGILLISRRSPVHYSEEERHLLMAICETAANALSRGRLVETLTQRVAGQTKRLNALYAVTMVAVEEKSPNELLFRFLESVLPAMHSQAGYIFLVDKNEHRLNLVASHGFSAQRNELISQINLKIEDNRRWLYRHMDTFTISENFKDVDFPEILTVEDSPAYLGVSIRSKGRLLGILGVFRARNFTLEDISLLSIISDQVSIVLENARLRGLAEVAAIEEERERLARDLHDSVTQLLFSINLLSQTARDLALEGDLSSLPEILNNLQETAQLALKDMRLLLFDLKPNLLEKTGLESAIGFRLDSVEKRTGMTTLLKIPDDLQIPPDIQKHLYFIIIEALNNCLKHSQAKNISVLVSHDQDELLVEVIDDGEGFNIAAIDKGGMGLKTMKERVALLGGRIEIISSPSQGTNVKMMIPLQISQVKE